MSEGEKFSPEVLQKLMRDCFRSPLWRLCNLYAIEAKGGKVIPFDPNPAQLLFLPEMHWANLLLKARQLGMSTAIVLYMFDRMMARPMTSCGIVDKTLKDATEKLRKIRTAYENLDRVGKFAGSLGKMHKGHIKMNFSAERIEFSNGSSITAGTSLRGGTMQILHVSELGYIAIEDPKKAAEIKDGAFNVVELASDNDNRLFLESTHEGGRMGLHYELIEAAMGNDSSARLSPIDFKFFFFAWWLDPRYVLDPDGIVIRDDMKRYFESIEKEDGIVLSAGQQAWYDRKQVQQKDAMLKEYPSTPEEALRGRTEGLIYASLMARARVEGRVKDFKLDPNEPVFTAWDIGISDYTSIWAVQIVGREFLWLDWYENNNKPVSHYAGVMREWDRLYNTIAIHFVPHDASHREKGSGQSYVSYMEKAGLRNVVVVPKTHDVWIGINQMRDIIPQSVFHKSECGRRREDEFGKSHPSGIDCLESYRTAPPGSSGSLKELPLHDAVSHSASAARTFAEAYARGMVGGGFSWTSGAPSQVSLARRVRVIGI